MFKKIVSLSFLLGLIRSLGAYISPSSQASERTVEMSCPIGYTCLWEYNGYEGGRIKFERS